MVLTSRGNYERAKSVISSNRRPVFAGKRPFIKQTGFGVKVVQFSFFFLLLYPPTSPTHLLFFIEKGPCKHFIQNPENPPRMSFSGRRLSILRPSENRRLSTTKDLTDNGTCICIQYHISDMSDFKNFQNSGQKPIDNFVPLTKVTVPTPVSTLLVPPPVSSGAQSEPVNMATLRILPAGPI